MAMAVTVPFCILCEKLKQVSREAKNQEQGFAIDLCYATYMVSEGERIATQQCS